MKMKEKIGSKYFRIFNSQVQTETFQGLMSGPNTLDLKLLHPTKEIVWVLQDADIDLTNDWLNFTSLEYPNSLDFVYKELINNSIELFYPLNKEYLDSDLIKNYLKLINENYGTSDINSENYDNDFNNNYLIKKNCKLIFNSHDRFISQEYGFFEDLQVYKYIGKGDKGIYCYNFGLNQMNFSHLEHQICQD